MVKDNGPGGWWADSATKGRCTGQTDIDWLVSYRTDDAVWLGADVDRIRFGAPSSSKVDWMRPIGSTQAAVTDATLPGITLCFGGNRYSESDVLATYIRLLPA